MMATKVMSNRLLWKSSNLWTTWKSVKCRRILLFDNTLQLAPEIVRLMAKLSPTALLGKRTFQAFDKLSFENMNHWINLWYSFIDFSQFRHWIFCYWHILGFFWIRNPIFMNIATTYYKDFILLSSIPLAFLKTHAHAWYYRIIPE